jgi:hypothetical protein
VLLIVLAGGVLPANPGFVATPVLIFCGAAFQPGPADVAFDTVDGAAGPQFEDAVTTGTDQVDTGLEPVRPQYAAACAVVTLAGSTPQSLPKPLNRVPLVETLC